MKNIIKNKIFFKFLWVNLLLVSLNLGAEENKPANSPKQPVQINAITQAAMQKGVNKCAGVINAVTNYLGFNNQSGALVTPNLNAPDTKTSSVVMEIPLPNNTAIVSATFSPQPNGCQASYDAVIYWPEKCEIVMKSQFASLKYVRRLKENVVQLAGPNINFYLMAAGQGCVSVKKEITE
jgi:hypothetical protein